MNRPLVLTCLLFAAAVQPAVAEAVPVDADAPAPVRRDDPHYRRLLERHAQILRRAGEGPVGLVFLGDSITEGWESVPEIWQVYFQRYHPANFGVDGDTTQGVIWRIANGEFDLVRPRVVVLLLGTNNTATHTPGQIADADRKIVEMIRRKLP